MDSTELKKELLDMGFEEKHIDIAVVMTNNKEEVINV